MSTSVIIIAHSISPQGKQITTFQLRYHRFIHAEVKTHRVIDIDGVTYEETFDYGFMDDQALSRNASSSRAIPVKKMIEDIRRDPAMPVYWGANKPGMQAGEELTGADLESVKWHWLNQMEQAIRTAEIMMERGLHKQIANRILEPWAHINVVVTATEFDNFFALRCHEDAQPEIKVLADAMRDALSESTPVLLQPGEWHLPYVTPEEYEAFYASDDPEWHEKLLKLSVARCARVSYLTQDGEKPTIAADLALYDRLVGGAPLHASPAEHQATPDLLHVTNALKWDWKHPEQHGNFVGWRQYRRTLSGGIV